MTQTIISREKPFAPAPRPLRPFPWACVTGRDFGRANAWARRQPRNPITLALGWRLENGAAHLVVGAAPSMPAPQGGLPVARA